MTPFAQFSMRRKVIWLVLLASALALVCVTIAAVFFDVTTFRPRALERANAEAGVLEEVLSAPLDFRLKEVAEKTLQKHCMDRAIVLAAVYDKKALFASYHRQDTVSQPPSVPMAGGHEFTAHRLALWRPVHNNENVVIGHLYVLEELPPFQARFRQYAIMAGAVLLALTVVGFFLMSGLRRNVLRPLATLLDTATHVSQHDDYSIRAAVQREDEIGKLARAFNLMLEAVGHREAALRENEERFRSLIENASDMISVIDAASVIRFQSPSAERVLGYPVEELLGRAALEFVHPDDLSGLREAIQRALASPTLPVTADYRFRHRNGSYRILESIGRSLPDQAPEGYIIVNSRDVTESVKMEEQLRQAQKMEALGQLSGGVAHDFNNLLTVILGHISLMQTDSALPPPLSYSVNEIEKAAERAAHLTQQLLAFGRRQPLQRTDLDLNEVVNNVTGMLKRVLGENIQLRLHFAPQQVFVHADAGMMEQILVNLAVNSRDAMPQGGQLVLETEALDFDAATAKLMPDARPGPVVCLSVSDNGCGIPSEILPRIFDPFFTTKDVGKGTGLGLATVYGIVQQHDGWIKVYSETGTGTTFRIFLPRLLKAASAESIDLSPKPARGGTETILVVEDEPALRHLTRTILERLGYCVLEAANGPGALVVWREHRHEIQLLLTDVVMPDKMTGLDLARKLHTEDPDLKVVYTSGYSADIAAQDHSLEEGVNFLAKPYSPAKLAQTVRASLDADRPLRETLENEPPRLSSD